MKRGRRSHYLKYREAARALAHARLKHFNNSYGFTLRKVFIKNHKSRWGSCSSRGNLNFNYKIAFLPPHIADYIFVHELCHLKHFNHSTQFWALVVQTTPNYKVLRKQLRAIHL